MISKLNSTRICGCPNTETLAGYVCDSNVPDLQNAKTCPFWEPFQEVLVIKSNFRTLMTSGNRGLIAASYPDIAALMWVLDGVDFTEEVAQVEQEAENNE